MSEKQCLYEKKHPAFDISKRISICPPFSNNFGQGSNTGYLGIQIKTIFEIKIQKQSPVD